MDKESNYDSEQTENYSRKLSEKPGEHPEEFTGVFDRRAERNVFKTESLEPKNNFP